MRWKTKRKYIVDHSPWWCSKLSGANSKRQEENSLLDLVNFFQILFIHFGGGTPYIGTEHIITRGSSNIVIDALVLLICDVLLLKMVPVR